MIELNGKKADRFLENFGIKNPQIIKVAGDASFRSYYRIGNLQNSEKYILMFAPPEYEDVKPFIKIDNILINSGFIAPKIYKIDEEKGFLLLEDFGDLSFNKFLQKKPESELDLYQNACDILLKISENNDFKENFENIENYSAKILHKEIQLFIDWYIPYKKLSISKSEKLEFTNLFSELFSKLDNNKKTLVLRDYHADNLMVLENHKLAILDFQDALIGSPAYDLVSLIEDARRDIGEENSRKIFNYYLSKYSFDKEKLVTDYKILSLQRNVKILGIFARLFMRDKKNNYLKFLPRVEKHVVNRLESDQYFKNISKILKNYL